DVLTRQCVPQGSHHREPAHTRIEYADRVTLRHDCGILPQDVSGVRHTVTIWPPNLPARTARRQENVSAAPTLPGRLAATSAALESPEKIEEGRGFLVERLVETRDAGRRLLC